MARKKAEKYEWVPKLNRYRKRIKDADGKYVALYGTTQKELAEKVKAAERQIEDAEFRRYNPTVEEYAKKWLLIRSASVRSTTAANYSRVINKHIISNIGDKYMSEVTSDDVGMILVGLSKNSSSQYSKVCILLKSIFKSALKAHIISEDPCEDLSVSGGAKARKKQALTDEQVKTLLNAVHGLKVETFVLLALYAGLRREEILALRWECIHLDAEAPYLEVRRSCHSDSTGHPVIEERTKTPAGIRDIPIPKILYDCLVQQKTASRSEYVVCNSRGEPMGESQFIRMWGSVRCRTIEDRSYYVYYKGRKELHTIKATPGGHPRTRPDVIQSIDFHVTPHQLRHTYITNLVRSGMDPKTVQYLAGHENISVTMDIYAHTVYNRPADLIGKINAAFSDSD